MNTAALRAMIMRKIVALSRDEVERVLRFMAELHADERRDPPRPVSKREDA